MCSNFCCSQCRAARNKWNVGRYILQGTRPCGRELSRLTGTSPQHNHLVWPHNAHRWPLAAWEWGPVRHRLRHRSWPRRCSRGRSSPCRSRNLWHPRRGVQGCHLCLHRCHRHRHPHRRWSHRLRGAVICWRHGCRHVRSLLMLAFLIRRVGSGRRNLCPAFRASPNRASRFTR